MKNILFIIILLGFGYWSIGQNFEPDASIWLDPWTSCEVKDNPNFEYGSSHWLMYDLGVVRHLSKTWIWNINDPGKLDMGFDKVNVDYSLDGVDWVNWGTMSFPRANGDAVYGGFPGPDLVGIQAQFVLLTAISNHGDANCFGLTEVKFNLLQEVAPADNPDDPDDPKCAAVQEVEIIWEEPNLRLQWEEIAGATEYEIFIYDENDEYYEEFIVEENFLEIFIEEVPWGETFFIEIITLCDEDEMESNVFEYTFEDQEDCQDPENLTAVPEETSVTLYWNDMGAVEYIITIYNDNFEEEYTTTETYLFVDMLDEGTSYYATVSVLCNDEYYTSEEIEFSTEIVLNTEDVEAKEFVSVYPNPFSGRVFLDVEGNRNDIMTLKISDLTGRTLYRNVYHTQRGTNQIEIDLFDLPSGVYLMESLMLSDRRRDTQKLIRAK